MTVRPLPGVTPDRVDQVLRDVTTSFDNVLGGGGVVHEQWLGYQNAATQSQRLLTSVITPADVSRLILTPRYWALLNYRSGVKYRV